MSCAANWIAVLPKVCAYFGQRRFINILDEMEKYDRDVMLHAREFEDAKRACGKIISADNLTVHTFLPE